MREIQSHGLRIGDRVVRDGNLDDIGTIRRTRYVGVTILWDKNVLIDDIEHKDMAQITKLTANGLAKPYRIRVFYGDRT